jgi:hypothetical protein
MNLATLLRSHLATPEPPELGPGPRPGVDRLVPLREKLDQAFADADFAGVCADLTRATVFLWHDHFDAAHTIAQEVETRDGSYVHAILHRREPDYDNAKYWFRRVGQHPCFPDLASRALALLKLKGAVELERRLVPDGRWDSFAFVDACECAFGPPSSDSQKSLLREIQRIEFEVLLEHLIRDQA